MRKFLLFLFITSISSCSSRKENQLPLMNSIIFEMKKGESVANIQPEIEELYTEYFNNQHIQIPLFRYIKHRQYKLFIGLPYNTSMKQLILNQTAKRDSMQIDVPKDSLSFFLKYQKEGFYITEYATIKENTLFYLSTMTSAKAISDSLLNETKLSERIKQTNP